MVCDSALYSQDNIQIMENLLWITRVPLTIKKAKELIQNVVFKPENKKERIEGILWLMSICLLVYNLGQRELRNELKRLKLRIKNQLGKLNR